MSNLKNEELQKKAKSAANKKASLGADIDLTEFSLQQPKTHQLDKLDKVSGELRDTLLNVGFDTNEKDRAGTYVQEGNQVAFCRTISSKVEVLPIAEAMKKYSWVKDYYWKAVSVDTDKYTAETELTDNLQGYFIYAKEGAQDVVPIQSCLFLNLEGMKQVVHNIIIAEKNAKLNIITGCTTHPNIHKGLHLGTSEFYLKEGSEITFTMVHYWRDSTDVRPRTGIIQEANSKYVSNYILMSEVNSLQSNPITYLNGDNSSAYFQTLIYGKGKSKIDVGTRAILNGKNTKAEMISRIIGAEESNIIARGLIVGNGDNALGHLECMGLLISDKSRIDSIPEINAMNPNISITHEAAVGKIAEDQILYLQSRGLSSDEARELIIGGFLEADTSHLPAQLARETEKLVKLASNAQQG
jgi:Fe-S cluster assembly scaffold protein SufB